MRALWVPRSFARPVCVRFAHPCGASPPQEQYFKRRFALLAAGVTYECGLPPLHLACARGDTDAARALLGRSDGAALVDRPSPLPLAYTPLMEAVAAGRGETARLLLRRGISVCCLWVDLSFAGPSTKVAPDHHSVGACPECGVMSV